MTCGDWVHGNASPLVSSDRIKPGWLRQQSQWRLLASVAVHSDACFQQTCLTLTTATSGEGSLCCAPAREMQITFTVVTGAREADAEGDGHEANAEKVDPFKSDKQNLL